MICTGDFVMTYYNTLLVRITTRPFWYDIVQDPFVMTYYKTLLVRHTTRPFCYDIVQDPFGKT